MGQHDSGRGWLTPLGEGLEGFAETKCALISPISLCAGVPAVHVGGESELWREMLKKVLASCDDALWPFAARTACVVGLHLQGRLLICSAPCVQALGSMQGTFVAS